MADLNVSHTDYATIITPSIIDFQNGTETTNTGVLNQTTNEPYHTSIYRMTGFNFSSTVYEATSSIIDFQNGTETITTGDLNHTTNEPYHIDVNPENIWSDECLPFPELEPFIKWVQTYYVPAILLFGSIGNLISCAVFLTSKLKKRSSSYYLAALAVADIGSVIPFFMWWLDHILKVTIANSATWCKAGYYFHYICCFVSVWVIVAFTLERFIAVQYPLLRQSMCTVARAKKTIFCITLIAVVVNSYTIVMIDSGMDENRVNECLARKGYYEVWSVFNILDILFTCIIPILSIFVFNVKIGRCLLKYKTVYKVSFNHPRSQSSTQSQTGSVENMKRVFRVKTTMSTSQHSLTKMLLIVSTVFVLLYIPFYSMRLMNYVWYLIWHDRSGTLTCLYNLFMGLFCTNININFLLYAMCGSKFRECLYESAQDLFEWSKRCFKFK